jgi:hypothetical protein
MEKGAIHFVHFMNSVVLKKCDNAATKNDRAKCGRMAKAGNAALKIPVHFVQWAATQRAKNLKKCRHE